MQRFLLVCGAGGAGSGARYVISLLLDRPNAALPWATLVVNLAGSFLMAGILEIALRKAISPELTLALTTGFLGGFTTYSAFNFQTTALASAGHAGRAVLNAVLTIVGCLVAGLAGAWLARRWP